MSKTQVVDHQGRQTFPSSGTSKWLEVLAAGILNAADANPNKPQAIANFEADRLFSLDRGRGTLILAEMTRAAALTADPVVNLVGRYDSTQEWTAIKNKNGSYDVTMTTDDTNDIEDGASTPLIHTRVTDEQTWDTHGFNEFAFVVKTAATGAGAATATLRTKVI